MTDEQINIAIAESLGWTNCRLAIKGAGGGTRYPTAHGIPPNRKYEASCPNYTSDLNACHEFEKTLDDDLDLDYSENLESVTGTRWGANNSYDMSKYRSATARQRCEAYLKTIGKWEEAK
jgi:hypothetical protein